MSWPIPFPTALIPVFIKAILQSALGFHRSIHRWQMFHPIQIHSNHRRCIVYHSIRINSSTIKQLIIEASIKSIISIIRNFTVPIVIIYVFRNDEGEIEPFWTIHFLCTIHFCCVLNGITSFNPGLLFSVTLFLGLIKVDDLQHQSWISNIDLGQHETPFVYLHWCIFSSPDDLTM